MDSMPAPVFAETASVSGRDGARSDFVYTVTIGARGVRFRPATMGSGGAGYSVSGCRYAITSASSIARSAAARIASCNWYSGSSRPGESVKMYWVSPLVSSPTTVTRVDCGLGETIARCSPTSALSNVDFPTLGRPARTTLPQRGMLSNISPGSREEAITMKAATMLSTLVLSTAATRAAAQNTAAIAQMTRGVADSFGPGFTALSTDRVQFQLTRPANVILLWVSSDGRIDLYYPLRSGDRNARNAG